MFTEYEKHVRALIQNEIASICRQSFIMKALSARLAHLTMTELEDFVGRFIILSLIPIDWTEIIFVARNENEHSGSLIVKRQLSF